MKGGLVKRSLWVAGPVVGCLLLAMFAGLATASHRLPTTTTITCPHRVTYTGRHPLEGGGGQRPYGWNNILNVRSVILREEPRVPVLRSYVSGR